MKPTATRSRAGRAPRFPRISAMFGRVAVAAAFAASALAAVSGCSAHATPSANPVAAAPAATQAPTSPATTTSTQGKLAAQVNILGTPTGLVPRGRYVKFIVTVTNGTAQTYSNVLPLVSLGHCSCTANSLFPAGKLQERESTSNMWQTIPYDVEGFGTDYLSVMEPGGIQEISPGAAAVFEYRVKLSPATSAQVTRGTGSLDVTLIQLPTHAQIGASPAGSTQVDVQSGQPPT